MTNLNKKIVCEVEAVVESVPFGYPTTTKVKVKSPKTGITLVLPRKGFDYCRSVVNKIATVSLQGPARAVLTIQDLRDFLNACEQVRDDDKDALYAHNAECTSCGGAHEEGTLGYGNICTSGCESTDGECGCYQCNGLASEAEMG